MRMMGIDYGEKRIGIAISDENGRFAFPYSVVENDRKIIERIKKICQEKEVSKIVLGQSLDYKGQPNPIMEDIEKFKNNLGKEINLPVIYHPEVLTTREAERVQGESKMIDASAAALILKSFIDKKDMLK